MTGWGQEIGPFNLSLQFQQPGNATTPVTGVNLTQNPYAFNAVANVIFIDQPVGTGLSYSDNTDDYSTTDTQTQSDLQEVMRTFFSMWPAFQNNDFYIAGDFKQDPILPLPTPSVLLLGRLQAFILFCFMRNPVGRVFADHLLHVCPSNVDAGQGLLRQWLRCQNQE